MVAGIYALRNGGADLRHASSRILFPLAYALILEFSKTTKEEAEAMEATKKTISDMQFEYDTGLPAIARMMGPADAAGVG